MDEPGKQDAATRARNSFGIGMRVVADPRTRDEARKISIGFWSRVIPLVFAWIALVALLCLSLGWIPAVASVACTAIGVAAWMINHQIGVRIEAIYYQKLLPQPRMPDLVSADQIMLTMEQGDAVEESFSDPAFRDASYVVNSGSLEGEVPALRVLVPRNWMSLSEDDRLQIAERLDEACAVMVANPDTRDESAGS